MTRKLQRKLLTMTDGPRALLPREAAALRDMVEPNGEPHVYRLAPAGQQVVAALRERYGDLYSAG